jgi:hypothetical protein
MLWLKLSTSRSDKPRRSRSALSRFPHSGFHDEAHIRRPIPKESSDVNPNTPYFNMFLNCFLKSGQNGPLSGRYSGHKPFVFFLALTRYVLVLLRRTGTSGRRLGQGKDSCGDCVLWLLIRVKYCEQSFLSASERGGRQARPTISALVE